MPNILQSRTKSITSAVLILAISSLVSQLLGIFRNNLLATSFPSFQTDIYFAAFRVPDLIYGLLITGGIVASFLPVFSSYAKNSREDGKRLTNNVLSVFLVLLAGLAVILAILAPHLTHLITPGFTIQQQALTVNLMRVMFLSPILLGLSAIISAVLQYHGLFISYALAPIFYNLGIIFGILIFYPIMGLIGLAWGVILGAAMHLFVQLPAAFKNNVKPRFYFNLKSRGLVKIFKLMLPRTIGAAAYHINLIVLTAIASTLSIGAISIFNYSNYVYGVPISLIGISFATAAFPVMSKRFAEKDEWQFAKTFQTTFSRILFFAMPISALIFILRAQLVRLLYGASLVGNGYFGWTETRLTAASVGLFAISLFTACSIPFLARVFFASHNTKTPVKIAIFVVALNISLSYFFVWLLRFPNMFQKTLIVALKLNNIGNIAVIALPLAISVSSLAHFLLMLIFMRKKIISLRFRKIAKSFIKSFLSSIIMAIGVWFSLRVFISFSGINTVKGVLCQLVFAGIVGVILFSLSAFLLKSQELKDVWLLIKTRLKQLFYLRFKGSMKQP